MEINKIINQIKKYKNDLEKWHNSKIKYVIEEDSILSELLTKYEKKINDNWKILEQNWVETIVLEQEKMEIEKSYKTKSYISNYKKFKKNGDWIVKNYAFLNAKSKIISIVSPDELDYLKLIINNSSFPNFKILYIDKHEDEFQRKMEKLKNDYKNNKNILEIEYGKKKERKVKNGKRSTN